MRENQQAVSSPKIETQKRANIDKSVEQHNAKNKWLDDVMMSLGQVENRLTPQEESVRQQHQRKILARFYEDSDGLELITETLARYPAERLLGDEYGRLLKGRIFEGLALASLEERQNTFIETEKFLLGILRDPALLKPLFEGIIPGPVSEQITNKSHMYLDTHDILSAPENDFHLLLEAINNTILSNPSLRASDKTRILAYLSYIEFIRKYSQGKDRKSNNDGIGFEIIENPTNRKQTIRITGLIEAKGYSAFPIEKIFAVMKQRKLAAEELYELVIAIQPFLEFFLEQLGLIDTIPSCIECEKPDSLSYTLIIGEGVWNTDKLEKKIYKTGTSKLIKIPFTPQEIWHLANFLVSSYQKK